jgi:hypothetical protein
MPKPPEINITDVQNISSLLQMLEQITEQQYGIKALAAIRLKFSLKHLNPTEQL